MMNKQKVKRNAILIAIAGLLVLVLAFTLLQPSLIAFADIPEREEVLCDEADTIYFNEDGTYLALEIDETKIIGEYIDGRTATSITFIQDDGTYVLKDFGVPLHYNIGGIYTPIDNTINENLTNTSNSFNISFSDGTRDALVKIEGRAGSLSMTPINNNLRQTQVSSIYVFDGQQNVTSTRTVDNLLSEKSHFVNERLLNEQLLLSESSQDINSERGENVDYIDEATYLTQRRAEEIERQLELGVIERIPSLRASTPLDFARTELFEMGLYDLNFQESVLQNRIEESFAKNSSAILFTDVFDGVDIQYILEGQSLKEYIIVYRPLAEYVFRFELVLDGLFANLVNGEILITDHRGNLVYFIPKGYMRDYAGIHSDAVFFSLESLGYGRYIFTITADEIFFETAQFPVFIDPTTEYIGYTINTGLFAVGSHRTYRSGQDSQFRTRRPLIGYHYRGFVNLHAAQVNNVVSNKTLLTAEFLFNFSANYSRDVNIGAQLRNTTNPASLHNASALANLSVRTVGTINPGSRRAINVLSYINNSTWLSNGIISLFDSTQPTASTLTFSNPILSLAFCLSRGINQNHYNITQDLGEHGSAIISLNNGRLNYVYESIRTNDGFLPIAINHVYDENFGNRFFVGYNFRLNLHQTLRRDPAINGYVYSDATGRIIYLRGDTHRNELGMRVINTYGWGSILGNRALVDRSGNSLVFHPNGHLIEVHQYPSTARHRLYGLHKRIYYHNNNNNTYRIDRVTNNHTTIHFVYNANNLLSQLRISQNNLAQQTIADFTYTTLSGRQHLTRISRRTGGNNNINTSFRYSGVRLIGIQDGSIGAERDIISFQYSHVASCFNYSNYRVSTITTRENIGSNVTRNNVVTLEYVYNTNVATNHSVNRTVILRDSTARTHRHISFRTARGIRGGRVMSDYTFEFNAGFDATRMIMPISAVSNGFDYFAFANEYAGTRTVDFDSFDSNRFTRFDGVLNPSTSNNIGVGTQNNRSGLFHANTSSFRNITNISQPSNRYVLSLWARANTLGANVRIRVLPNGSNAIEYRFNSRTTEWQFGAIEIDLAALGISSLNSLRVEIITTGGAWNVDNLRLVALPMGPTLGQQRFIDYTNASESDDPNVITRRYNADGQIRLIRQFNPIDQTVIGLYFEYSARNLWGHPGRLLSITEGLITGANPAMSNRGVQQSRTVFNYDPIGRLQSVQTFGRTNAPRHLVSTREYHNDGRLQAITDENGVRTIFENIAVNATTRDIRTTVDNRSATGAANVVTTHRVNIVTGELTNIGGATATGTPSTSFGYNTRGQINRLTHNGFNTNINYFVDGSLQSIAVPGRTLVSYTYSTNQDTVTFGNQQTIRYNYNADGQLTSITNGQNVNIASVTRYSTTQTITHANGVMYSFSDGSAWGSGFSYDMTNGNNSLVVLHNQHNRVDYLVWQSGSNIFNGFSSHTLNNRGQLATAITPQGTRSYTYDNNHRPQRITTTLGSRSFRTDFEYLNPAATTTTNLVSRQRLYVNNLNRAVHTYEYFPNGNLHRILNASNQVIAEFQYDSLNRLTREIYPLQNRRFDISYNAGGNINWRDEFNYQTGARIQMNDWSYSDPNGWRDLLTSVRFGNVTQAITYDGAGNPLSYRGATMTWMNGRQLQSYTRGNIRVDYEYDFAGIRTRRTVRTSNIITSDVRFLVSGARILGQVEMVNGLPSSGLTWFHYDSRGVSGMRTGLNGVMTDFYFERNILGSVVGIWNMANGTLVGRYMHDAWGNELYMTVSGTGATYTANRAIMEFNPFRWKGYYFDSVTGFYYLQSRYYDPMIGRFINADYAPMLFTESLMPMGANLFMYCFNNPVMFRDDTGYGITLGMMAVIIGVSIVVGATIGGISAAMDPNANFWDGVWRGALIGAMVGISLSLVAVGVFGFAGVKVAGVAGVGKFAGKTLQASMALSAGTTSLLMLNSAVGNQSLHTLNMGQVAGFWGAGLLIGAVSGYVGFGMGQFGQALGLSLGKKGMLGLTFGVAFGTANIVLVGGLAGKGAGPLFGRGVRTLFGI